jgi:hypothetical protein
MYKSLRVIIISLLLVFWSIGNVLAYQYMGQNITINDNISNSTWSTQPSQALGQGSEDNETEQIGNLGTNWNTYTGQKWDFEGMFWDPEAKKLYIVAGWNFQTGVPYNGSYVQVGDAFTGTLGSIVNGSKAFNPDGALDFQRSANGGLLASGIYSKIGGNFNVLYTEYHSSSILSDPWEYSNGGVNDTNPEYTYTTTTNPVNGSTVPFVGWIDYPNGNGYDDDHYILTINGLTDNDIANEILHITLYCGNDVGRGQYTSVPEPASILLFGLGLMGIAGIKRKFDD